jgi:hypothetical protein
VASNMKTLRRLLSMRTKSMAEARRNKP